MAGTLESRAAQHVAFGLAVVGHVFGAAGVEIFEHFDFRALDDRVTDDEVEARLCDFFQPADEKIRLLRRLDAVDQRPGHLAEPAADAQTVFVRDFDEAIAHVRCRDRRAHVVIHVRDLQPLSDRQIDLRADFILDFVEVGLMGHHVLARPEEMTPLVHQRRDFLRRQHRPPLVRHPLGVEADVHADADLRMLLENLDRLVEPAGVHDHAGGGDRSLVENLFQRHVAGMREAEIIGADDQANLVVAVKISRRSGRLCECNRSERHRQQDDSHQLPSRDYCRSLRIVVGSIPLK